LKALECGCGKDDCGKCKCIYDLTSAVDSYVPMPERAIDKPFLMAVEDVFSISGRGTVVTGRVERGVVKVGDEVEIIGLRDTQKTVATGVEMFRKLLDQGQRETTSAFCFGGRRRTTWSAVRCWRSRGRSRRTRSSRRRRTS